MSLPKLPPPFPREVRPYDVADPRKVLNLIFLLRGHVDGIVGAATDLLRSPSKRRMKRRDAAHAIALGARSVKRLLDAAEMGLPSGTTIFVGDDEMDPPSTGRGAR